MWERFTDRARKVMALANQEAQRFGHNYIGTEHIFFGLIKEGSGRSVAILKDLGVDMEGMLVQVEQLLKLKGEPEEAKAGETPPTADARKVVEYAIEEARLLGHDYIGAEHILLGLLRVGEGIAAQVLNNLGVKLEDVRSSLA